jgi:ABC-2 type transport system permease protein
MDLLSAGSRGRILTIAQKDAAELARRPGAILPAITMVFGALVPAFLVVIGAPILAGESLEQSGEFADEARAALSVLPELAGLDVNAQIQAFLFHQFALLLLLATHAVIGEKQARALEPLLATPLSTVELLAAKTLTPLVFAVALTWISIGLYIAGIVVVGEPGVWRALITWRTLVMFGALGPLVGLAALQLAVIVSSRANDPRSAQQLASLMIVPITALFVGQMLGAYVIGTPVLVLSCLGCVGLNVLLAWVGIRVFDRETILMRWK